MIKIFKTEQDFIHFHLTNSSTIGFVPTMGNLHDGHLSLITKSKQDNEVTVLSIFVNPTQFSASEDLLNYPRTLEEDIQKASAIFKESDNKTLIIFIPENEKVIYPDNFSDYVTVNGISKVSEGAIRPTHFDGVATVVKRLFKIVQPNKAYFGKKDFQQLVIIEKLVLDYNLGVEIIGMPIIREKTGLAMSSRNSYLSAEQKEAALYLCQTLNEISKIIKESTIEEANKLIAEKVKDKRFNYLEIRDPKNFEIVEQDLSSVVILGNLQIGKTRLLDNLEVNK